nr:hypothetical protein [Tanacetum cinerariifolium]
MQDYRDDEVTPIPTLIFSVHNWALKKKQPEGPPFTDHMLAICTTNEPVHAEPNAETEDTSGPPPLSPKSIKIQEMTNQALLLRKVAALENLKLDLPAGLLALPGQVSSINVQFSKLKVLDALLSLLNKVTEALDSPPKTIPQPEGDQVRDKGKKALSHEEVDEEESESNFDAEVMLTGSLVESSKQKLLKKFSYVNEQGDTFFMTEEEIKNQKKIEQTVKADMAKAEIKKGKITNCDVLLRGKGPITLNVYKDDGSDEIIQNFKQRLDNLYIIEEELELDFSIPLGEQDYIIKLNTLAKKRGKMLMIFMTTSGWLTLRVSMTFGARYDIFGGSASGVARSRGKDRGFSRRHGRFVHQVFRICQFLPPAITIPLQYPWSLPNLFVAIVSHRRGQNERVFPTVADWHVSAPKDEMPAEDTYSSEVVAVLNTHRTPIQKQPEALLCLVGLSRRYFLGDDVYPIFLHDDDRNMDLFNLICAPNPTKVKIGTRPRVAHEIPLLTVTASRVIEMEDLAAATDSSGLPSTIESSPLDFANENPSQQSTRGRPSEGDCCHGSRVIKERRKKGMMGLGTGSTFPIPTPQETPADVSDPDPLSFANPQYANISYSSFVLNPDLPRELPLLGIQSQRIPPLPPWSAPPGYFSEMRHLHNDDFLRQYNINLARQVAMGSQLRLRFEQEAKLLKKSVAQVARRDQRIQARENKIKNLEALLKAETDMKIAAKAKNAKLVKELESLRALFADLQVSNDRLSQQVSTLQAQVTGEEKLKASFEEFKKYEDDRVEKRCAEMDARQDALSIDFDEELYPHMFTAIAGRRWVIGNGLRLAVMKCRRWVIGNGLRLAVMKCDESTELRQVFADVVSTGIAKGMSEGLKYGVEHGKANLDLESIEAYDLEVETKYVTALHALRDLKYPMVDQMESLKDAPIDVIMASLHLESDSGEDAPQWISELRPSSSQLKIHVYPKVRDPKDPWSFKEEIMLVDAITANISHAEKKMKCRVVCHTHGFGSAHHARCDGVPVSVHTVASQGLVILLANAATQTETSEDGAFPSLLKSKSLPAMYNLD